MSAVPRQSTATPSWQQCLDAGMTAKEAAKARGVPVSKAYNWAHGRGARFKPDKRGRPVGRRSEPGKVAELILLLHAEGFSRADIARFIGCSYQNVRQTLLHHGAGQ